MDLVVVVVSTVVAARPVHFSLFSLFSAFKHVTCDLEKSFS